MSFIILSICFMPCSFLITYFITRRITNLPLSKSNFYLLRFSFNCILNSEIFNHFSTLSLFHCLSSGTYVLYYFCIVFSPRLMYFIIFALFVLQNLRSVLFLHCSSSKTCVLLLHCLQNLRSLLLLNCLSSKTCVLCHFCIACPPKPINFITFALLVLQDLCNS